MQYAGASDLFRLDNVAGFRHTGRLNTFTQSDFLNVGSAQGEFIGSAFNGGSNIVAPAAGVITKNHPGVWRIQSSTTANGGYTCNTNGNAFLLGGNEVFTLVFMTPGSFSTVTTRFGFLDATTPSAVVDGAFFAISTAGVITGNTVTNGTASATPTIATLATSAWYHARLTVNAAGTSVLFEVFNDAGSSLGSASLTTNIPTAAGRETGAGFVTSSSGTTAVDLLTVDYMEVSYLSARARGSTGGF